MPEWAAELIPSIPYDNGRLDWLAGLDEADLPVEVEITDDTGAMYEIQPTGWSLMFYYGEFALLEGSGVLKRGAETSAASRADRRGNEGRSGGAGMETEPSKIGATIRATPAQDRASDWTKPHAALAGRYYANLRDAGFAPEQAMELVVNMQTVVLTPLFERTPPAPKADRLGGEG